MTDKLAPDQARFCHVVERNIMEVVDELKAIDLVDLVSFIRFESFPTVEDLVNTSTELFFQPGMLVFSWAAAVDLRWDELPVVTIGMEFRHPDVTLFFDLTMRHVGQSVDILGAVFDPDPVDAVETLSRAFAEARVMAGPSPVSPRQRARRRSQQDARKGLPWP